MKIPVHNLQGERIREIEVSDDVFDVRENVPLVHQVAVAQMANARRVLAHTKDRGEVRGGGRKPWKQKGTGRARHGSIRSPLWVGGGVTFGPTKERNFTERINKKMKQKALACLLSDKIRSGLMIVLDKFEVPDKKTKSFVKTLEKLPWNKENKKKALIALEKSDSDITRSARNVKDVFVMEANNVNVFDVMRFPHLIATEEAIQKIEKRLL